MSTDKHICPNCGDLMVPAEASLNRSWFNYLLFGYGSSQLQIRPKKGRWLTFMTHYKRAKASYCTSCGALLVAPTMSKHRKELGID